MIVGAAGSRPSQTTSASSGSGSNASAQPGAASAPQPAGPPRAITARGWAKIAKDPDSHVGEAQIVYGKVTQFDAATGTNAFRANVDGVKHQVSYGYADYPTNTMLTDGADLSDLVEGDLFQAEAVVAGSVSYQNTMAAP